MVHDCLNCGEEREILAHGLCAKCYRRNERAKKVVDRYAPGLRKEQVKTLAAFSTTFAALFTALILLTGCADQEELKQLRQEVAQLKAQKEADGQQRQANKMNLSQAINEADSERSHCKLAAERAFNQKLHANGTPDPAHKGFYTLDKDVLRDMNVEQDRENADCQRTYENEVQAAKIRFE
jgi:hypothetical protein